jgi:hypothetical protein
VPNNANDCCALLKRSRRVVPNDNDEMLDRGAACLVIYDIDIEAQYRTAQVKLNTTELAYL